MDRTRVELALLVLETGVRTFTLPARITDLAQTIKKPAFDALHREYKAAKTGMAFTLYLASVVITQHQYANTTFSFSQIHITGLFYDLFTLSYSLALNPNQNLILTLVYFH